MKSRLERAIQARNEGQSDLFQIATVAGISPEQINEWVLQEKEELEKNNVHAKNCKLLLH